MYENRTRRDVIATTGGVLATVALAGCSNGGDDGSPSGNGGGGDAVQTSTVDMTDELTFEPKVIQVEAGTTVTWENVGNIGHTVTAYDDQIPDDATYFASGGYESQDAAETSYDDDRGGNVPAGESYEQTFETTGTYEYYCIPHELSGMVGTVEVV